MAALRIASVNNRSLAERRAQESGRCQEAVNQLQYGNASLLAGTRLYGWTALVSTRVESQMKCKMCCDIVERFLGSKTINYKWIVGADSVKFSNVREHDQSYQHAHA